MNGHTPRRDGALSPSPLPHVTGLKRDSFAAELERDPQLSASKRQARTAAFTTTLTQAALERQLVTAQTTKMELMTKLREKEQTIERLERDRRWFCDREAEEKAEKEKERAFFEEDKKKADTELKSLRNTLSTLQIEHADLQDKFSSLSRTATQSMASQKSQISLLTRQVEMLEQDLSQTKQLANERLISMEELKERLDELSSAQNTFIRDGADKENMSIVQEELHRQADYLRSLETANIRLTAELSSLHERHTSIQILREEKRGLETKVRTLEEMRDRVVSLEAQVEAARREREDWANKGAEADQTSTAHSLSVSRLDHARLLEEHGSTKALLRSREAENADLESRNTDLATKVEELESKKRTLEDSLLRKQHQVDLAERDVKFLRALVESFKDESGPAVSSSIDAQRLTHLESLLETYKSTIASLQSQLDTATTHSGTLLAESHSEAEILQTELAAKDDEITDLLQKVDSLEQELFDLRGEIAGGRHVPPGVRILQLKENPYSQWVDLREEVMQRLRGENEALINRLREVERRVSLTTKDEKEEEKKPDIQEKGGLVPRESYELLKNEKEDLEDKLKNKEKRLQRLQQVFSSKGAEFRDAITSLLGVKLAFYPNGQVRVTSIFDLNAAFVFQPSSSGSQVKMQLVEQGVESGGPENLADMMTYWIRREECIPGFLASVTLECYDKAKREGSVG